MMGFGRISQRIGHISQRIRVGGWHSALGGAATLSGLALCAQLSRRPGAACHDGRRQRVVLVRHGESEAQVQQLIGQAGDSPLTAKGVDQAHQLGTFHTAALREAAAASRVASSSQPRAIQTAVAALQAAGIEPAAAEGIVRAKLKDGLREVHRGIVDGKSRSDRDVNAVWVAGWARATPVQGNNRQHFRPVEGAETYDELQNRSLAALEGLLEELPAQGEDGPLWVFCHSLVIRAIVWRILGVPADVHPMNLGNASVTIIERKPGGIWTLVEMNDTAHFHRVAGSSASF